MDLFSASDDDVGLGWYDELVDPVTQLRGKTHEVALFLCMLW